ncbi:hypothetical protein [Clostridium faecium]|nr:hypothetical protein [Clostridium faecium]
MQNVKYAMNSLMIGLYIMEMELVNVENVMLKIEIYGIIFIY